MTYTTNHTEQAGIPVHRRTMLIEEGPMVRGVVRKIAVPRASLAARAFSRVDYADAYRITLPPAGYTVDDFARTFLGATPGWVHRLMAVRERAARLIGLKRVTGRPQPVAMTFEPGDVAGIFRVFARSADEIVLGEDDRHLDFRVSFLVEGGGTHCRGTVATVVRYHGRLGRAYFLPVRFFHRWIVGAMLRATAERLARRR